MSENNSTKQNAAQRATHIESIAGPSRIGPYEIHTIETGSFGLDGGAMFGIVPKTIWNKTNPADELNRIEMQLRCLLLLDTKATRAILIDNGIGQKWPEKLLQIYGIDHSKYTLDRSLKKLGLTPADITDVIATHLHFDHMGGTTRKTESGELVPAFENAKIWVQERNWDLAYHPNEKDRASYLKENFDIYNGTELGKSKLQLLQTPAEGREQILPGISVRISNGHTLGLQLVEIADDKNSLLYCADAIPTSSHIKVPYIMGYDCYPLTMIDEKKKILKEATDRNTILFFEHCPRAQAASVFHDGKDFALKQAYHFTL